MAGGMGLTFSVMLAPWVAWKTGRSRNRLRGSLHDVRGGPDSTARDKIAPAGVRLATARRAPAQSHHGKLVFARARRPHPGGRAALRLHRAAADRRGVPGRL